MYKVCLIFLMVFICFSGFSQTAQPDTLITQVYGDHASLLNAEQLNWLHNCLQRTQVLTSGQVGIPEQGLKLLSTVHLQFKFTQSVPASPFNPDSFNPLMYAFDYFDQQDQYFKVDGTGYIIKISGKNN